MSMPTVIASLVLASVLGLVSTGLSAQQPLSGDSLDRTHARRADAAISRIALSYGRAQVAIERIASEVASIKNSQVRQAPTQSRTIKARWPKNRLELYEALATAEQVHGELDDMLRTAQAMMAGLLPAKPKDIAVPEWAETIHGQLDPIRRDNATPRSLVLHLETLAFRIEQLTQETEICEEQAIGLAELHHAKRRRSDLDRNSWRFLGPAGIASGEGYDGTRVPVSGRVSALSFTQLPDGRSALYAGAAHGGLWRSMDKGRTWQPLTDTQPSLAVGALLADNGIPGRLYVGTGEANVAFRDFVIVDDRVIAGGHGVGLLRTSDGGISWDHLGQDVFYGAAFADLAFAGREYIIAATTKGLYRSRDEGVTWEGMEVLARQDLPATSIAVDDRNPNNALVALWAEGIFQTNNLLASKPTWQRVQGGLPLSNIGRSKLAWGRSEARAIYALISTADHRLRGLYESNDNAESWNRIPGVPDLLRGQGFYHMMLGVHPENSQLIFFGGGGERRRDASSIYKLTKNDGNWSVVPVGSEMHIDFHAIAFDPADSNGVVVGNDGGIWRSTDLGETWLPCNEGLGITQVISLGGLPGRTDVLFAGTQDNGTLRYDGGVAWTHVDNGDGGTVKIDAQKPSRVFNVFSAYRLARSDTGGAPYTFKPIHPPLGRISTAFLSPFDLNPYRAGEVALGAHRVYVSSDAGEKWSKVDYDFGSNVISALAWTSANDMVIGLSRGQVFLLTRDRDKWTISRIFSPPATCSRFYVASVKPMLNGRDVLIAAVTQDCPGLWIVSTESEDKAPMPRNVSYDLAGPIYTAGVGNATGDLVAGTATGVYVLKRDTSTWSPLGKGLPKLPVFDLAIDVAARFVRAGTFGRGVWELAQ